MNKLQAKLFTTLGVMTASIIVSMYLNHLHLSYINTDESMSLSCYKFAYLSLGISVYSFYQFVKTAVKIERNR